MSSDLGEILLQLTGRVIPERVRDLRATVVLQSPDETWTMWFGRGRMTVGAGAPDRADTIIRADAQTLSGIQAGAISGLSAFLDGRISVRGNLNLALRAESMFEPLVRRPVTAPIDRTVIAGGREASVVEAGKGDPVVLLHGLGATKASFATTILALAPRHRVIAPDLLGHGDSAKPRVAYSAATMARFVLDIMDELDVERAHLVGNSLGGRVALEVAMTAPDRVRSVACFCPAVAFLNQRWLSPFIGLLRPQFAIVPRALPHRAVVAGIRGLFVTPDRLPSPWYDAAADEFRRVYRDAQARYALFDAMRHLLSDAPGGETGFWMRLSRLDLPAMFLWGDGDPLVSSSYARHVEMAMPAANSEVLRSCGHVPQFELPVATHRRLKRFIAAA